MQENQSVTAALEVLGRTDCERRVAQVSGLLVRLLHRI